MSTQLSDNPPTIGHNNPPRTLAEMVELLDDHLAENYTDLLAIVDDLATRALEYHVKGAGKTIAGPADVEKVKEIIIEAKTAGRVGEAKRKAEKDPFYRGGMKVDAWFGDKVAARAERITKHLDGLIKDYQDKIEAEERARRAAEEKKRLAEEAHQREIARRAEEAGRVTVAEKALAKADNAAAEAEAARQAAARAAEVRTSADAFAGVSSRKTWTFKIDDAAKIDLNKLRSFLALADVEKALRAYVKANRDTAPLDGVTFYEAVTNAYRA